MVVPGQSAQRDRRFRDHSLRTIFRRHASGAVRRVREPAFGRRHRLRSHCRRDRDPRRERVPTPCCGRGGSAVRGSVRGHVRAGRPLRQARSHRRRDRRGRSRRAVLGADHHRRLRPALHALGIEGHIFGPMAKTYAFAIAGALVATFTISPAFAALLLPERVRETETLLSARYAASMARRFASRSPTVS